MLPLALIWGLTVTQLAVCVIGIAGIVAIVLIALKQFEITPPAWFIQVLWVLVVVFVCIAAVLLIRSMMAGA